MVGLEENRDDSRRLDNPAGRGKRVVIHHTMSKATLGWMAFLQIPFAFLVQRFRPWQHGDLDSARAEILKELSIRDPPDSRQVRFPIGSLRRRGRHVWFSVWSSRNSRSRVVHPLGREWKESGENDNESRNQSRHTHVSLPPIAGPQVLK